MKLHKESNSSTGGGLVVSKGSSGPEVLSSNPATCKLFVKKACRSKICTASVLFLLRGMPIQGYQIKLLGTTFTEEVLPLILAKLRQFEFHRRCIEQVTRCVQSVTALI